MTHMHIRRKELAAAMRTATSTWTLHGKTRGPGIAVILYEGGGCPKVVPGNLFVGTQVATRAIDYTSQLVTVSVTGKSCVPDSHFPPSHAIFIKLRSELSGRARWHRVAAYPSGGNAETANATQGLDNVTPGGQDRPFRRCPLHHCVAPCEP